MDSNLSSPVSQYPDTIQHAGNSIVEESRKLEMLPAVPFNNPLVDLIKPPEQLILTIEQQWPLHRKLQTYLTICCFTFFANVNASNLTMAIIPITKEFGVTQTRAAYLVCFNVLLFGCGNLLWVPLSRIIGMRPVYLTSLLLLVVTNVWSMKATSYGSLLASRIISGLAASAGDATVPAVVASMFMPTHRGRYLMVFQLSLTSGIFFSPIFSGLFIQHATWRWSCGLVAIGSGVVLGVALVTLKETRPYLMDEESSSGWRQLLLFLAPVVGKPVAKVDGFKLLQSILLLAVRPQILWASFTIGTFVGWIIIILTSLGSTFSRPPWHWKPQFIGFLSFSGFLGSSAAFYVAGRLVDLSSNRLTKAGEERRPEYRLPPLIIPAVIGPMGLIVIGQCIGHETAWIGPAFGYAMQAFGLTAVSNIAITYAVDNFKSMAGEALVAVFIIRNTIAVICSLYSPNWLASQGPMKAFGEMAGIQYFFLLLALPLYFFGDKLPKVIGMPTDISARHPPEEAIG